MSSSASGSSSTLHPTSSGVRLRHEAGSSGVHRHAVRKDSGDRSKGRKTRDTGLRLRIGSRGWVKEGFRIFGEHCARNQIRTLLIDCLVMTNLFYPALSIYLQKRFPPLHPPSPPSHNTHRIHAGGPRVKKEHPLSLLSTPVLDSFFPYPPPLLPRLTWTGWWGRDTGQADEWVATHLAESENGLGYGDDEIRILRIGWADVGDVLDREDNDEERQWQERDHVLLRLVRETTEGWNYPGESCVRELGVDQGEVGPTGPCYLLSPTATKVDDESTPVNWAQDAGNVYHSVATLFRISRNSTASFDTRWQSALVHIAKSVDAELFEEALKPRVAAAEQTEHWLISHERAFKHSPSDPDTPSSTPKTVLFLYLLLFTILGAQLSAATKVHSRFGLALTGIVQLCCSAVMSFSVLALLGWNGWGWNSGHEKSLPTYVLPFVIVVVGAENMSTLTKAVFSIPFTHAVPVRIGLGLRKVGTTIALTSLTDLALLGVIWLFVNVRPVREFCLFAAVVIITDWFMLHTFFLTVLSIDAQRLELADVLAGNAGNPPKAEREPSSQRFSWRKVLRARTTKSGSLLLILISIGLIYYLTERHRLPLSTPNLYGYKPVPSTIPDLLSPAELSHLSYAEKLWRAINPLGLASIRVIIPPAAILVLPRPGHLMRPADIHNLSLPTSRLVLPRLKPLFYLFKVVILPQAVTAGALYSLLLYLLKDSDLLDAQRNRLGRGEEERISDDEEGVSQGIDVHLLPCSHESDVDLVASSEDGSIVVSVGIDNGVCLWRFGENPGTGTRETLRTDLVGAISAVDVSPDGKMIVMAAENVVQMWDVVDGTTPTAREAVRVEARVVKMKWAESKVSDPFLASKATYDLVIVQSDGVVKCGEEVVVKSPGRIFLLDDGHILTSSAEGVALHRSGGETATAIPATHPHRITAVASLRDLIAVGHRSGLVEVFDTNGHPLVAIGAGSSPSVEGVRRLALRQPASSKCSTCGTVISDSIFVLSSTSERFYVDRINTQGGVPCRCTRRPSADSSSLVVPPTATRGSLSPGKSPTLLPPVSNGEFPLSSHGTRRLSALHRDDANGPSMTPMTTSPAEEVDVTPLGAVITAGGGDCWEINEDVVTGMRRVGGGIDDGQWEVWSIDLRSPWNGQGLVVESAPMMSLVRQSAVTIASVKAQRVERLLSLSGRAPFPSLGNSFSVATYSPLAYVEIRPFKKTGGGRIVMGMGNRLGVISLPVKEHGLQVKKSFTGLSGPGLTPPPPVRRDTSEKIELSKKHT